MRRITDHIQPILIALAVIAAVIACVTLAATGPDPWSPENEGRQIVVLVPMQDWFHEYRQPFAPVERRP